MCINTFTDHGFQAQAERFSENVLRCHVASYSRLTIHATPVSMLRLLTNFCIGQNADAVKCWMQLSRNRICWIESAFKCNIRLMKDGHSPPGRGTPMKRRKAKGGSGGPELPRSGRNFLARIGHVIERFIDRFRPARSTDNLIIEPYVGYGTPEGVVVRGRVLSAAQARDLPAQPGLLSNIRAMVSLFLTREVADVLVDVSGVQVRSDEEGYFTACVPIADPTAEKVTVGLPDHGFVCDAPIVIPNPAADVGIISDIDDTIMQTGAYSLMRNIWTTFSGSVESRTIFPDTVALIRKRQAEKNPVFFVSSSPWNLHAFLDAVFQRNKVPFGPKFLRDLGISRTQFIKDSHGSHKGDAIDAIVGANPALKFILIGDTGQHDGQVYLDAIARHGAAIIEVCLRDAGPLNDTDADVAGKIRNTGVAFYTGPSFAPLLDASA